MAGNAIPDGHRTVEVVALASDGIALNSVSYRVSPDRTAYPVEVKRGWIGKPKLEMPAELWRGTGYDPKLKGR